MPKFLIKLPNGLETSFFTPEEDVFIGRIPSINDVCVNHPSISRQHAQLRRRDGDYTVYDLESLNGLYVNGERVTKAVLHDGDSLRLGEVSIQVGLHEHGPSAAATNLDDFEPTEVGIPLEARAQTPKKKK